MTIRFDNIPELEHFDALKGFQESSYDMMVELASYICDVDISAVGLVDKKSEWLKSKKGIDLEEISLEDSFSARALIEEDSLFIVEDATKHKILANSNLVKGKYNIRFFAGAVLKTPSGIPIGTLCVMSSKPKILSEKQLKGLHILGNNVCLLIKLKYCQMHMIQKANTLNEKLGKYAHVVAHDLQDPVRQTRLLLQSIQKEVFQAVQEETKEKYLLAVGQLKGLNDLIVGTLKQAGQNVQPLDLTPIDSLKVLKDVLKYFESLIEQKKATITIGSLPIVCAYEPCLAKLFQNLISNALKYDEPSQPLTIEINAKVCKKQATFSIRDTGIGLEKSHLKEIFVPYKRINSGQNTEEGYGIGLSSCQDTVRLWKGNIWAESDGLGRGSAIFFTVPVCK